MQAWLRVALAIPVAFVRGETRAAELCAGERVVCRAEDAGSLDEAALMRAELEVRGRDTIFERVLQLAGGNS
jgi:hypothetical protein